MTYDLLSDFLCGLSRHLPCFFGAGHLPLHMASDGGMEGRWRHQRFLTMQLAPSSSWSSQLGAFAPNIHNPHDIKRGPVFYFWMACAFFHTSCKNKTIMFQIARMNYNKLMFLKNNLNGKVHTSQKGSLRVWQNWTHFSLLLLYFS